jgi:serine incorporator 1/3
LLCRAGSNTTTFTLESDEETEALMEEGDTTSAGLDGMSGPEAASMQRPTPSATSPDLPVTYNYSFFHLLFALASCYIAMLLTGWGRGADERNLMDIGWASVTMKLLTLWCTGLLYVWVLLAPTMLQDRAF